MSDEEDEGRTEVLERPEGRRIPEPYWPTMDRLELRHAGVML